MCIYPCNRDRVHLDPSPQPRLTLLLTLVPSSPQLHEAALKQLAEALEPAGFLKQPEGDALWRAVEQAKEVGVPESRLVEARKKLAEIEEKERGGGGGFLGLGHLAKLIPGCAGDRRADKGRMRAFPGEAPSTGRMKGGAAPPFAAAPTVEGGKKSDDLI